jgi:hypothetical protein
MGWFGKIKVSQLPPFCRLLSFCAVAAFVLPQSSSASDDPPTAFSRAVTAALGDWEAEDWRKGSITLHPNQYTWQSDIFLNLAPEEPVAGRTLADALKLHFGNVDLGDDSLNPTKLDLRRAQEMAPGILAVRYDWEYAFDDIAGVWGVVRTNQDTFIPFIARCERDRPEFPKEYPFRQCVEGYVKALVLLQNGALRMPEAPQPLTISGWDGQYLFDGTSIATSASWNGLRSATIRVSPPLSIAANDLPAAIKAMSDQLVEDNDQADKSPGTARWVGTTSDPWIRREYAEAFDGPSVHMAGAERLPDGRTILIAVRCPNAGWLTSCAEGVEHARFQAKQGIIEAKRQAIVMATQKPLPAGGIKDTQLLGIYAKGEFNGQSYVMNGYLYLRDGSVYRNIDQLPAMIELAKSRAESPGDWGRWTRTGSGMAIVWGDGDRETVSDASPANLFTGGSAGTRLDGDFQTVSSGNPTMMPGAGFVSRANYHFYPDGTFESAKSSSFAVSGYLPGGDFSPQTIAAGGSNSTSGRAKYRIEGYTLTLTYPDGRIERLAFATYPKDANNPRRETVLINGTPYTRDNE